MAPKSTKSSAAKTETAPAPVVKGPLSILSPREQIIMLQSMLSIPDFPAGLPIDHSTVADRMGLKPRSITNAWCIIKKKLSEYKEKGDENNGTTDTTGTTGTTGEEDAGKEEATKDDNPVPKKRARTAKATPTNNGTPKATPDEEVKATEADPLAAASSGESATEPAAAAEKDLEDAMEEEKLLAAGKFKMTRVVDENGKEAWESPDLC